MTFSPGENGTLFAAPTPCTMCGTPLELRGKGRRPKYCSKACSSKADRQRERERLEAALATAAVATENPRGETPLPADLAADKEAAELLEFGAALRQHDVRFLLQLDRAARHGDAALARQALDDLLHVAYLVTIRHREAAERLLDSRLTKPAAADAAPQKPAISPRREIEPAPGTDPAGAQPVPHAPHPAPADSEPRLAAPRGETTAAEPADPAATEPAQAHVPPRGETAPTGTPPAATPVTPRGEILTPAGDPQAPRGPAGHLVHQAALLTTTVAAPMAPNPPTRTATVLADAPRPDGLPDTDVHQDRDYADGPDLALGRATGWMPPTERGLGTPQRSYTLGQGLVHLTWPHHPSIQALEQYGRPAGWIEAHDGQGAWIAFIAGHPVVDAADDQPLLSANPTDALTLLRLALAQRLAP
ncbi:hypothetical protein [Kitasatospora sp. NBC_01302]|uniref:hypothetical protein n=1 Tax=Kitasatospora sp. NBC_01302 TaxID=2903575 RepID=UPI002E0D9E07|nr:hypothetical protein OG294_39715 [Kitasatospora sp. NBC_01302]